MRALRKLSGPAVVVAVAALAMLAWWVMLAAERAALRATEDGARDAAVGVALAVAAEVADGGEVAGVVEVAEEVSGLRLLLRDEHGHRLAGDAAPVGHLETVEVPGAPLTVAAEVDASAGLGIGRFSRIISLVAFAVLALALGLLRIVARDRRRARAEIDRLGQRWDEVAAADDLTGLGNRARLIDDAGALIARGTRYGNSFGLAVFELEGDPSDGLVLAVAETLASESRGGDLCYRLRAGRFVVLLPEQDETGAVLAADRIRRQLADELGQVVRTGAAAFSPWLPCSAGDLLTKAELDLGERRLIGGGRVSGRTPAPLQVLP